MIKKWVVFLFSTLVFSLILLGQPQHLDTFIQEGIKDYITIFDQIDYKGRLSKRMRDIRENRAKVLFEGSSTKDARIFEDYVTAKQPFLLSLSAYFEGMFTMYDSINIDFESHIFYDNPRDFKPNDFHYSKNLFTKNGYLKSDGVFAKTFKWLTGERKKYKYVRTGIERNFGGKSSGGPILKTDTILLYWGYKGKASPKIILSAPITTDNSDRRKFDGNYWLNDPGKLELEKEKNNVLAFVRSFYASSDSLTSTSKSIDVVANKYFVFNDIPVESDLGIDGKTKILKGREYLESIAKHTKIDHSVSNSRFLKEIERDNEGFRFSIHADLKVIIDSEGYSSTNTAPVEIAVKVGWNWKTSQFSNPKIEKIKLLENVKSIVIQKPQTVNPPNEYVPPLSISISTPICGYQEALSACQNEAREKIKEFVKLISKYATSNSLDKTEMQELDSLFLDKNKVTISVSSYLKKSLVGLELYHGVQKYLDHFSKYKYKTVEISDTDIEIPSSIGTLGKFWFADVKFKQWFDGIGLKASYCDTTLKTVRIWISQDNCKVYLGNIDADYEKTRKNPCGTIPKSSKALVPSNKGPKDKILTSVVDNNVKHKTQIARQNRVDRKS